MFIRDRNGHTPIKYDNKYSAYECMYNQGVPAMTVTL